MLGAVDGMIVARLSRSDAPVAEIATEGAAPCEARSRLAPSKWACGGRMLTPLELWLYLLFMMQTDTTARALAALGHETRLALFRLLIKAG
ncbi:MAG: hypothetical protein R6V44_10525, partial [Paracoccaceae bacterium]